MTGEWRARRGKPLSPDDPRHGTVNGYINRGCRCEECRDAWREYHRPYGESYRRRKGMQPKKYGRTHGIRATYVHEKCRCDECREAERTYRRQLRARQREAS